MTWQKTLDWLLENPATLGCLAAIGFTQLIKFLWPRRWRDVIRHWATVATAMALAFTVTVTADPSRTGVAGGIVAALFAPTIYVVLSRVIGVVAPNMRKALSADHEPKRGP